MYQHNNFTTIIRSALLWLLLVGVCFPISAEGGKFTTRWFSQFNTNIQTEVETTLRQNFSELPVLTTAFAKPFVANEEIACNVVVRAKGNCGGEEMHIRVGGVTEAIYVLTTSFSDYLVYDFVSGQNVTVAFVNDEDNGCDYNVEIDYIQVDQTRHQTETVATRTGCGNTTTLWCNGTFDFGNLNCGSTPNTSCSGTTYSTVIAQSTGQLQNVAESLGNPDGSGARFSRLNTGTYTRIVWDLGTTYEAGSEACILVKTGQPGLISRFRVWILTAGVPATGSYAEVGDIRTNSEEFVEYCFTMPGAYRYIKVTGEAESDFYVDAAYANCPVEPNCDCGENLLPNGSFEYNDGSYMFSIPFESNPSDTLSNNGHWNTIYNWNPGLSGDYMFYIDDRTDQVNNPDGDYFVWLPAANDCWVGNTDFSTRLGLEDGEQYQLCFYAASWNVSRSLATGLPDGNSVSQSESEIKLEMTFAQDGFQEVGKWPVYASDSWTNLDWQQYTYTFTYDASNGIENFLFTNATNIGIAIDAVTISKVDCSEREVCIGDGIDNDGDGLADCTDPDCYGVGQAQTVVFTNGVDNAPAALYTPDGEYAQLYDSGDRLILDLGTTLPIGTEYSIVWRRKSSYSDNEVADIQVEESLDAISFNYNSKEPTTTVKNRSIATRMVIENPTRFLRLRQKTSGGDDFDLDAITFTIDCPGCSERGTVNYQKYVNLPSGGISTMTSASNYPDDPDEVGWLNSFNFPDDIGENYGVLVRSYLYPEESGNYTFITTADDVSEVYLSIDQNPDNKTLIAYNNSWTNPQGTTEYPSQTSNTIYLHAGNKYYLEYLGKENTGGDHFQLYWKTPSDNNATIISGKYLSSFQCEFEGCIQTMDFETDANGDPLVSGDYLANAYAEWGVTITTDNPSSNPPMVFNSVVPTGGDNDLGTPNQDFGGAGIGAGGKSGEIGENNVNRGNAMIISENNNPSNPDDNADGGTITLTYAEPLDVAYVELVDADYGETNGRIRTYDASNNMLNETRIIAYGDNSFQYVIVDQEGVSKMEIYFPNSGSVTAIYYCKVLPTHAAIGDLVWSDIDGDGVKDTNESGIADVTVQLFDDAGNLLAEDVTDANGNYLFPGLMPGSYQTAVVANTLPSFFLPTYDLDGDNDGNSGTITISDSDRLDADFGYRLDCDINTGGLSINDPFVCLPPAGDGVISATPDGNADVIDGFTTQYILTKGANNVIEQISSTPSFTTTSAGQYAIHTLIYDNTPNSDHYLDLSFINFGTTQLSELNALIGQGGGSICAGLDLTGAAVTVDPCDAQLGDLVWGDLDADGIKHNSESGMGNVTVQLSGTAPDGETITATTTTNGSGIYSFDNLPPGTYEVTFVTPNNYLSTYSNEGNNDNLDSDPVNGKVSGITLASSESNQTIDAGYYQPAAIGDFVFEDENGNGIQNSGEAGLSGVTVTIEGTTGNGTDFSDSTPTAGDGSYAFTNLVPGTYQLTFGDISGFNRTQQNQGTDDSLDSDANKATGRTNNYSLISGETNNTVDAGYLNTGDTQLGDFVFEDLNANGIQDTGEPGIAGVTVRLDGVNGISLPILTITTTTDANGLYLFDNLEPGIYTVTFVTPNGYTPTYRNEGGNDNIDSDPNPLTNQVLGIGLQSGEQNKTIDAGFYRVGTLGDFVWDDLNGNGVQDGGEPGINNVSISLTGTTGNGTTINETTTTNGSGYYQFPDLIPGTYAVTFNTPTGFTNTYQNEGGDDTKDSDINSANNQVTGITIASGGSNQTIDAGYYKTGNFIGDYVWEDLNANGLQDSGEPAINNVAIALTGTTGNGTPINQTTSTNSSGLYSFTNLIPGTYRLTFTTPNGLTTTYLNEGSDDEIDSDVNVNNGLINNIPVISGTQNNSYDAGYYNPNNTIGDYVWEDLNGNGVQDSGEPAISGVEVTLSGQTGNGTPVNETATTNGSGLYNFNNLIPGTYTLTFAGPTSFQVTDPNAGGNDANDSDIDATNQQITNIVITSNTTNNTYDAGYLQTANLGDYVWEDLNGNGIQDIGEPGINNVTVTLTGTTGDGQNINETKTTNGTGFYQFINLLPGTYEVTFTTPNGFTATYPKEGSDDRFDSDVNPATGKVSNITLTSGMSNLNVDAGFYKTGNTIGDYVWEDLNANGLQESGEPAISGVAVTLTGATGNGTVVTQNTTTDANGLYTFIDLIPGIYTVTFDTPNNYSATYPNEGIDDTDSDAINGEVDNIEILSGTVNNTIDAGFYQFVSIGDYVWIDLNEDGIQDNDELGLSDVTIHLYNDNNQIISTTQTDNDGYYLFENIPPGNFVLEFETPFNYVGSDNNQGGNIELDSDPNPITGVTNTFSVDSGQTDFTIDAGFYFSPSDNCDYSSNISSNFNGTDIDGGNYLWFNSHFKLNGFGTDTVKVFFTNGIIQFSDNGLDYTLNTPNATITFVPDDITPITTFDNASNTWISTIPINKAQKDPFLTGLAFPVPASGIEGGVKDVIWQGTFTSDSPDIGINWQWSAANYTDFSTDYNSLDVEVVDDKRQSGTPKNYEGFVTGGARGGGGSNFTGSNSSTGSVILCEVASIGDFVWHDVNGNGLQDNNESGLENIEITLTGTAGDGTSVSKTTTTNASGLYFFNNLIPGTYSIQVNPPANYQITYRNEGVDDAIDSNIDPATGKSLNEVLEPGENNLTYDAGLYLKGNTIGDYVWEDTNGDGIQDAGEPIISGVGITLTGQTGNGTAVNTTTITDGSGLYEFTDLVPGTYTVTFATPNNFVPTYTDEGTDDTVDSDPINGEVTGIVIQSGTVNKTIDAGYIAGGAKIGDFVFEDINGDGIQDTGESGIEGVTVTLAGTTGNGSSVSLTTRTDANGNYIFDNLLPGTYTVTFSTPANYAGTYPNEGGDDELDSDAINGVVSNILIESGTEDLSIDAGYYKLGNTIGDYVWEDMNANGIQESGEPVISGVAVTLNGTTGNGTPVTNITTTTDANGLYNFTDLIPGTYSVTFGTPNNFAATYANEGTDDELDSDAINGEVDNILIESGTVNNTIDAGFYQLGSQIGDFVFEDLDGDGIQDAGESGIENVTVTLTGTTGNGTPVSVTVTTDSDGNYIFDDVIPGTYTVTFGTPDGFTGTYPNEGSDDALDSDAINGEVTGIVIQSGDTDLTIDAGFYKLGNTIGDYVWEDTNGDGIQDAGEPIISGVGITLTGQTGNGTAVNTTTITDGSGLYEFTDLVPGTYTVTFTTPNNFVPTYTDEGTDDTVDSDPINGAVTGIEILSGTVNKTIDAGYIAGGAKIGDFVFEDINGDGIQDNGEPGIAGVEVTLTGITGNGSTVNVTTTTDVNGNYIFDNLLPGTYTITFSTPANYAGTYPNEGGDDALDSDAINGVVSNILIESGTEDLSIDAGYYKLGNTIGDYVWEDMNANGIQESGEPVISGVAVTLTGTTGNGTPVIQNTTTDANGLYEFTDLIPGTYSVTFGTPNNFAATYPNEGTDDELDSDAINGIVSNILIESGTVNNTIDAGFYQLGSQIGDFVFEDLDGDGIQDDGEPGIPNVTVTLTGTTGNGTPVSVTVITDSNGNYIFDDVIPGTYTVTFGTPDGFIGTYPNEGGDDANDSDAINGEVIGIVIQSGDTDLTIDAGFYQLGNTIGDYVWEDTNGDGIQDAGEPIISGVGITLTGQTGNGTPVNITTITDGSGLYEFTDLVPGTYTVTFTTPNNFVPTYTDEGTDDTVDSDPINGEVTGIVIQSGTVNKTIDAGYIAGGAKIGDFVFEDIDGDGIQDNGEPGIAGVEVTLTGTTGNGSTVNVTTTTDANGNYLFDNLLPGTYTVNFSTPANYAGTYPNEGSDDDLDSDAINGVVSNILIESGTEDLSIDAGYYKLGNTIGDYTWEDMNANGIQDSGEPVISGVAVTLNGTTGNGTAVTQNTTTDANGLYNFTDLIPGTYSVTFGTPNNFAATYANEGTDDELDSDAINGEVDNILIESGTVNNTIDAGFYQLGSQIGDFVFEDLDGDGIQDAGESGIENVTVTLTGTTGNGTPVSVTVTTDSDGNYIFDDVVPGSYTVTFGTPDGYAETYPNEGSDDANDSDSINGVVTGIVIQSGDTDLTIDAGFYQLGNTIGDYVWEDTNGDGIQDAGEPIISGVGITLTGTTGNGTTVNETTTTDVNGLYEFTDLVPGTYTVIFTTPNNFVPTYTDEGTDDTVDSDPINGEVTGIVIQSGTVNETIDAGYIAGGAKIGDFVFEDIDGDGIQDNGEPGIAGVEVTLTGITGNGSTVNVTTTTDVNGNYLFDNLLPGTYTVNFTTPANYAGTYPNEGSDDNLDSDAINGVVSNILIESGTEDLSIDAGYYKLGNTIGDYVWEDMNANGIQDSGEPVISGVAVTLNGTTGNGTAVTQNTTTDANGLYNFTDLIPGTYSVTFGTPTNFAATYPNEGTDDELDSDAINGVVSNIEILSGTVNNTIDAGFYQLGSQIGDFVFEDLDGDGIQDTGEPGILNVTVTLTGTTGNGTPVSVTITTDSDGNYIFDDVIPGTYTVTFGTPDGYTGTYPNEGGDDALDSDAINGEVAGIVIQSGDTDLTIDAGFYQLGNTIGDYVWEDTNGDGIQDAGEPIISGVGITLTGQTGNGTPVNTTTITDGSGLYEFTDLVPGTYTVTFATPNNFVPTYTDEGTDDTVDSDPINGEVTGIVIQSGTVNETIDAGYIAGGAKIGDFVFEDIDGDGIQDNGEPGIAGVEVTLTGITGNGSTVNVTTTTDVNGNYIFDNLLPGTYTVTFSTPVNYAGTYPNEGSDDDLDSDAINGVVSNILIESGTEDLSIDAGYYKLGNTIGDYVWEDMNANGIQDSGEPVISGVAVTLNGTTGNGTTVTQNTTTDANGLYEFTDLIPGTYSVTFGTPNNFAATYANEGADDALDSDAVNGVVSNILIESGTQNPTIDAGFYKLGNTIGDYVFEDQNGNGIQDNGEPGITGIDVTLTGQTGNGTPVSITIQTDVNGNYNFTDIIPGTYTISFATPTDFTPTFPNQGGDDTKDSDAENGQVTGIVVVSGTVNNTIDAGFYGAMSQIGNYVWIDMNGDGLQDTIREAGLEDVTVTLYYTDVNGNPQTQTTLTDIDGYYLFDELAPGTYSVGFENMPDYSFTAIDQGTDDALDSDVDLLTGRTPDVTLASGESNLTLDAGFVNLSTYIGNYVWIDQNGNGLQDAEEPGVPNVTVTLTGTTGSGETVNRTLTTDADGFYMFTEVFPGDYEVSFSLPTGYKFTYQDEGSADFYDSDVDPATNTVVNISTYSGLPNVTIDAGIYQPARVGNYVWEDNDGDGLQGPDEAGIEGMTLYLQGTTGNGTVVNVSTTTDATGYYIFDDLVPGTYQVFFDLPSNFVTTVDDQTFVQVDELPATAVLVNDDYNVDGPFEIEVFFSEPITGLTAADFDLTNATITNITGSGEYYMIEVTPTVDGMVYVSLPDGTTTDEAGNSSASSNTISVNFDMNNAIKAETGMVANVGSNWQTITLNENYTSPVVIATVNYPDGSSLPAVSRIRNAGGNSFELRLQNPSDTPLPADYTVNYFVIEEGVYTEEVHGVDLEAVLATTSVTASSGNWVQEPRAYQQSYNDPVVVGQVMSYNDPDWSSFWASADNCKNPANASELNAGIQVAEDTDTDRASETIGYIVLNEGSGVIGDWQFTADTGDRIVRGPDNFYYGAGYDYYFYGMSAPTSAIVSQAGMRSTDGGWAVLAGGANAVNPNSIALLTDQDQIQDGERYNTRERVDYVVFEPAGGNNNLPAIVPPSVALTTSSYTVTGEFTVDINSLVGLNDLTASDFIITNGTVGTLTGSNGDYQLTVTPTNGGLVTIEIPANAVTNDNGEPNFVSNTLNVFFEELSATPYSTIYPAGTGADEVDSDPDGNTSKTPVFVLYSGDENLTIDAGVIGKTALGDFVWEDVNANGIQDNGEPGIANVTVTLTGTTGDGTIVNETTTTDGLGLYAFNDLFPGTYTVTFTTPNGYSATYNDEGTDDEKDSDAINGVVADIVVTSSNPNLTIDAGFYNTDNRLGDYVWEDVNGNGLNDSGEPAVNNVSVTLNGTTGNGTPVNNITTTTDGNGYYQFTNIIPGNYSVTFGEPTGYQITHANQGTDDTIDSDPSRGTGIVNNITVISGTDDQTIDAGLVKTNTGVGDYVWEDVNGNGVQDNGEPGIVGHTITLSGIDNIGNNVTRTTTTIADGYYEFVGLFPGTYTVTFDLTGTFIPTFTDLGGNDETDSDADQGSGAAPAVTLLSGDFDPTIDAGFYAPVTIGDYVWLDENQNGTQDEPTATAGINGVVVNLYYGNCGLAANGSTPYRTTTTAINPATNEPGWYEFADIPRGDYCVSIDQSNFAQGNALVGKFASPADATGDDTTDSDGGNNHRVFLDDVTSSNPNVDFGYYGTPDAEEGFCYVIADAGDYFALIDQTTGQLMVIGQVAPPDGENLAANPLTLEVYNVSGENAATSLITIDDQTGATNVLNADIGLDDVDALAFSPFTNELYAMKADPIPGELYRVDKNTGATQLMTSISLSGADPLAGELDPHIDGMSFHPQTRELYGVYSAYGSASYLVKIDTTSGVATFVGTDGLTGVDDIEDISFAPDGTLYGVLGDQGAIGNDAGGTYEGLVTIDPNTAQATPIGLYGTPVAGTTWDVEAFACLVPPSCGIDITNIDPGDCYNSDGTSRSDITVTVAWTNAPSDENIVVSVNGQQQTIPVTAGSSSNADVQFIMPSNNQDYEITATFESGNCTNIATQTYTAPVPCCYVEIRSVKPYPCIGDKYDADVVVFYADHVGKQITINGQTFGTADSTGIEKFLVKNLDCGLAMEDIVVTFADEPAACTDTKSFTPPGPCSVTIDSVVPTACALDKYDIAITFTFANPPSEIDINGCRFRPSGQSGTETFLLKGQDCATASDLPLTITFVDDGGCNDGDVITAPCPQPRVCAPGAEVGRVDR